MRHQNNWWWLWLAGITSVDSVGFNCVPIAHSCSLECYNGFFSIKY